MPRKKSGRPRAEPHTAFVFEICDWKPSYTFSVNGDREKPGDFSEYAEIELDTVCVLPEKLADRAAHFILSGRRNYFDPPDKRRAPEEAPRAIGLLTLPPGGGGYYGGVPHDTLPYFMAGLAAGRFRYLMLLGPSLYRSMSDCFSLHFMRSAELEEGKP